MIYSTKLGIAKFAHSCASKTRTVSRCGMFVSVGVLAGAFLRTWCDCRKYEANQGENTDAYRSSLKVLFVCAGFTCISTGTWGGAIAAQQLSRRLIQHLNPRSG